MLLLWVWTHCPRICQVMVQLKKTLVQLKKTYLLTVIHNERGISSREYINCQFLPITQTLIHLLHYSFWSEHQCPYFLLPVVSHHVKNLCFLYYIFIKHYSKTPLYLFFPGPFLQESLFLLMFHPQSFLCRQCFAHPKSLQQPRELVILVQVTVLSLLPFKTQHIPQSAFLAISDNLNLGIVRCWTINTDCFLRLYFFPFLDEISRRIYQKNLSFPITFSLSI